MDDSISEKPCTDENDIIAGTWSHSPECHVKGLDFLTACYQVEGVALPSALQGRNKNKSHFYQGLIPCHCPERRRTPRTKSEI
jgi:hypothetical protein